MNLKVIAIFTLVTFTYFYAQNDPLLQYQWNLTKIMAPAAWNITTGSSSITIAIIDCGIQSNHPDLQNKLVTGYDVLGNDNTTDPYGNYYHGTACAGVAAAETNNGIGIAGVGYSCKIMPIQIAYDDNINNPENFISGLNWAVSHGADIICFSGHTDEKQSVLDAIDYATTYGRNGRGCIIVKSAGNLSSQGITFPGRHSKVIAVGATDQNDNRIAVSSYGPELDVMAPSSIYATDISGPSGLVSGDYFGYFPNTSSSAPQVAGLAGLILSIDNNIKGEAVRKIICYTADDINTPGFDNETGWGRINAWKAVDAISHKTTNGTLPRDEIWYNTVNLTGNVIVPLGVTLKIISGAAVNLVSGSRRYSIFFTGGTITVENGATINGLRAKLGHQGQNGLCGTIQAAVDNSNLNNNIYIQSGTFNENITIANKSSIIYVYGDDKNNTIINGNITIVNSYYPQLYYLTAKYIGVSGCTNARVEEVIITPWSEDSEWSLMVNNCSPFYLGGITLNDTPYGYGAYFSNSTGQVYQISQPRFENNEIATYFINSSSFTLSNVRFCSNGYDIITSGNSSVLAQYVTFSGNPNTKTSGNVSWGTYYICGLLKNSSQQNISGDINKDFGYGDFQKINTLYQNLISRINEDQKKKQEFIKSNYRQDFDLIIDNCKKFFNQKTSSVFAPTVINIAGHLYKQFDKYEELKSFVIGITGNKNVGELSEYAKRLMIDYYTYRRNYNEALSVADDILSSRSKNEDLICEVLLTKGMLYQYSTDQKEEAIKIYEEMLSLYPQNGSTKFAKEQLKQMGIAVKEAAPKLANNSEEKIEFSSSNYPNPFNPTTKIKYSIPESGLVVIKIYDMLGKEIAVLVNDKKPTGQHEATFDGSSLPSGIYFYSINYNKQILTGKMLLLK